MNTTKKIGKAGSGTKIHVVITGLRQGDNHPFEIIVCGAQQFNGTGNGHLRHTSEFNLEKVTCKRCLKNLK